MSNQEPCNEPDCGVCTRADVRINDEETIHIVEYVGDYVIQTAFGPEYTDLSAMIMTKLSGLNVPRYLTVVGYVGTQSIRESESTVPNNEYMRFAQRHDDPSKIEEVHDMIVDAVKSGIIDPSSILSTEEIQGQLFPSNWDLYGDGGFTGFTTL